MSLFTALDHAGVMGINARNGNYIMRYNPRALFPLVDDKLLSKQLALDNGLPVPELYGVIRMLRDIRKFEKIVEGKNDFVLKPVHGSGGNGIMVIGGRSRDRYRTTTGRIVTRDEMAHHMENTLGGQFSLGGQPDQVLVEYRVKFDPVFDHVSYLGVPDIRIIVFKGVPVMAMIRLPTRSSDGKANLHMGGVGVGIDMRKGVTTHAVVGTSPVHEHPDTGASVVGLDIPHWQTMLEIASSCYEITGLGYLGVDLVLDAELGPLMLEMNARPGLNIQIANGTGLRHRLTYLENLDLKDMTLADRIAAGLEATNRDPRRDSVASPTA
ncbi:MAG: alpha-L-glutamate ligase-like protein [Gammaproteobacteria bacterium]|jgi:alpha-L-glutamate ligase-like protein|nr:alpha-L-glutamate ligase-like protein [Gammaproteobacteria bacterium]